MQETALVYLMFVVRRRGSLPVASTAVISGNLHFETVDWQA